MSETIDQMNRDLQKRLLELEDLGMENHFEHKKKMEAKRAKAQEKVRSHCDAIKAAVMDWDDWLRLHLEHHDQIEVFEADDGEAYLRGYRCKQCGHTYHTYAGPSRIEEHEHPRFTTSG